MKTINLYLLISVSCFLACCSKEKIFTPVQPCTDLSSDSVAITMHFNGNWQWLEDRITSRGYPTQYLTPNTVGYYDYISIDHEYIYFLRTGSPAIKYKFKLVKEKEITFWHADNKTVLALYNPVSGNLVNYFRMSVCKDQLILFQSYRSDGDPDKIYKKVYQN